MALILSDISYMYVVKHGRFYAICAPGLAFASPFVGFLYEYIDNNSCIAKYVNIFEPYCYKYSSCQSTECLLLVDILPFDDNPQLLNYIIFFIKLFCLSGIATLLFINLIRLHTNSTSL